MRRSVVAFAVLALALPAVPAFAAAAADSPMKVCSQQWQAMKKAGTAKGSYKDFSKTCLSKGGAATTTTTASTTTTTAAAPAAKTAMAKKAAAASAAAPAPAAAPAAAAVTTTASTSTTKTTKAKGAPTVKASDTDPTGATAQCKDGTYSHSKTHSGSCAGHKGVAKFLT